MEQTLKLTSVLSDPTRFYIYEFIIKHHKEVTVQEVAEVFEIHPNVARLHLSKLEDVNMLVSETKKTGKGGRPSRLYRLSNEVIQLHFPHRDYQLLSKIAFETFLNLGEVGKSALYDTGKNFGKEVVKRESINTPETLSVEEKISLIKDASTMLGLYPKFHYNEEKQYISFGIFNCPFKEVAHDNPATVCEMHGFFIKGMFEVLFGDINLLEEENMLDGCNTCSYKAHLI